MASTILEKTRFLHEDIERYEKAIEKELGTPAKVQQAKAQQQHNIDKYLDHIQKDAGEALQLYADREARQRELDSMSKGDVFKSFYADLEELQAYHKKFPGLVERPIAVEPANLDDLFSGEEYFGKYMDLHAQYELFVNLPHISRVDYITYLGEFFNFKAIGMDTKMSSRYSDYLASLCEYLISFYHRAQPLVDVDGVVEEIREDFAAKWSRGEVEGWNLRKTIQQEIDAEKKQESKDINAIDDDDDAPLDTSSVEAIERLGADKLKSILQGLGAKCGGSLRQRAERLFTILHCKEGELPLHLLKGTKGTKGVKGTKGTKGDTNTADRGESIEVMRPVAEREFLVRGLCEELRDVVDNTQAYNEKKTVQSFAERQKDEEAMEVSEAEEEKEEAESDDDKPIYNPLNLPLGWDGKPIPYWLYKLYGLGEEFKCEICGNHSYWGRRAFDNHFQEWRHHNGMRCLGIPNTKHFHDITKIEDAKNLYAKIKDQLKAEDWSLDEEEFEDADGNVLSKKMYNDLVRQGLIWAVWNKHEKANTLR